MANCKIMYNNVSKSGGGLHLSLKNSDFEIKSTIITNNVALDGGGIYFNSDGSIQLHNFKKSLL